LDNLCWTVDRFKLSRGTRVSVSPQNDYNPAEKKPLTQVRDLMLARLCGAAADDSLAASDGGAEPAHLNLSRRRCLMLLRALAGVGAAGLMLDGSAWGASTWNVGSSNWNNQANWTPNGVPGSGATVDITNTDGVSRVITYDYTGAAVTLGSLTIDLTGSATNADTLLMASHNLSAGTEYVGDSGSGSGGIGVINQSGGTNMVGNLDLGVNASDAGFYYLNSAAATLTATTVGYTPYSITVGDNGSGTMNVSGGSTVNAQQSTIGNIGTATGNVTVDD
jgi:hypothetical protein